jgi:hypothetical protein
LREDAFVANDSKGRVYDLSRDPDFFEQPANTGNIVEFAIRYFHSMATVGRYCVRALLIGISLGIHENAGVLGAPKGSILFVDSRYPQLALRQLSRMIYLIDTQKPLT